MHVEELRDLALSLACSLHHGDRLLLSSQRELRSRSTLAAGGPGTRQPANYFINSHFQAEVLNGTKSRNALKRDG
jgi:hypothetical protein